jgi:hypothetical protein
MLTEDQKASIRLYLGYPDEFRYKHTRLESMLTNLSAPAETQIAGLLAKLATIETAFMTTGVTNAGVKRVDEIWFENGSKAASEVRKTGRTLVGRISIITGVPIYSDVFGTAGYLGDSFSPGGGRSTGFYGLG